MTWHWDVRGGDLGVWDHDADPTTDDPIATSAPPDGTGWSWSGDRPGAVLDAMHAEAEAAIQSGDVERAIAVTLDMAGEQIERYGGD